jgi:hypothetical protein
MKIVTDTLYECLCIFVIISCCIHPRMTNVTDTKCRENKKKHFPRNITLFKKILPFLNNVTKDDRAENATSTVYGCTYPFSLNEPVSTATF